MKRASALIVDDEPALLGALRLQLTHPDWEIRTAGSVAAARAMLTERPADVAFIDFELGDGTGAELLRWAAPLRRVRAAFCITGAATCEHVVDAMRAGFIDVVEKPFDIERLRAVLRAWRPNPQQETRAWRDRYAPQILGEDPALLEALGVVENVADSDCGVLITGASGTGKELVARALHDGSSRAGKPFVAINCAAIPESLIEAELFGHTRGAFTGAVGRGGHIAAAQGGTLFLDEIGDMPLPAQARLLRVLQERMITPLGSDRPIHVDIRVVAATHQDVESLVESGQFRTDLFFRLCVVRIQLPSLAERPSDILLLAGALLAQTCARTGRSVSGFDDTALAAMAQHPWTGNVRELHNCIERAVLLRKEGKICAQDLQLLKPRALQPAAQPRGVAAPAGEPGDASLNLRGAVDDVERQMIRQALDKSAGNRTEAAALLGLNRTTLIEKMRRLAIL